VTVPRVRITTLCAARHKVAQTSVRYAAALPAHRGGPRRSSAAEERRKKEVETTGTSSTRLAPTPAAACGAGAGGATIPLG
jgi:hypothetical protein